jgi:glycerol uptake facilitator-like aquaporin
MPEPGNPGKYYYVPPQNGFYPKIIDEVEGLPAYGQVFFAECFGTAIIMLFVLYAKWDMSRGMSSYFGAFGMAFSFYIIGSMFTNVSGGVLNPALSLGKMAW